MTPKLEINNLVKKFGGLTATNNLSLEIESGESVGLIGPNGSGKTTIFNQIMGELIQTSGSIKLDGLELTKMSTPARIRQGVSRTYQVPRPFAEMTVAENIRVGLMPDDIIKLITIGPNPIEELRIAKSVGFKKVDLLRMSEELSMGELRKLEMGRTMATRPSIMLLDEVFAGLTSSEIEMISDLIQKMRTEGMTFMIVSHDLKALEPLVDRVIAIDSGNQIAQGSYHDVINSEVVRLSYLGES